MTDTGRIEFLRLFGTIMFETHADLIKGLDIREAIDKMAEIEEYKE